MVIGNYLYFKFVLFLLCLTLKVLVREKSLLCLKMTNKFGDISPRTLLFNKQLCNDRLYLDHSSKLQVIKGFWLILYESDLCSSRHELRVYSASKMPLQIEKGAESLCDLRDEERSIRNAGITAVSQVVNGYFQSEMDRELMGKWDSDRASAIVSGIGGGSFLKSSRNSSDCSVSGLIHVNLFLLTD